MKFFHLLIILSCLATLSAGQTRNFNLMDLAGKISSFDLSAIDLKPLTDWFNDMLDFDGDALVAWLTGRSPKAQTVSCKQLTALLQHTLPNVTRACMDDLKAMICGLETGINALASLYMQCADDECKAQAKQVLKDNQWTFYVLDSMGKIPSGHYDGHLYWVGDYRECTMLNENTDRKVMQTKHCTAKLKTYNNPVKQLDMACGKKAVSYEPCPRRDTPESDLLKLHYGFCAPRTCSELELGKVTYTILQVIRPYLGLCLVEEMVSCDDSYDNHMRYDPPAVVFVCIAAIIISISVFGTFLSVVLRLREKKTDENSDGPTKTQIISEDSNCGFSTSNSSLTYKQISKSKRPLTLRLLDSINLENNVHYLTSCSIPPRHIHCVHGIKVITVAWICHAFTFLYILSFSENMLVLNKIVNTVRFQVINNASLAGDSFLFISGLVFAYQFFFDAQREADGTVKSWKYWLGFIGWRLLRILPIYMLTAAFQSNLFDYTGSGAAWYHSGGDFSGDNCGSSWWTNLLFVNNFVRTSSPCLPWTWYIAVEMQLFLFTIPLLILYYFMPYIAFIAVLVLIAGSTILNGVWVTDHGLPPSMVFSRHEAYSSKLSQFYDQVYTKPYMRISSYLIGTVLGHLLYATRKGVKIPKPIIMSLWLGSIIVGLSSLFGLYDYTQGLPVNPTVIGFYAGCARWAWALAIGTVVFLCHHGHGGIVNWFLSLPMWLPLSKLTYSVYLIIPLVAGYFYKQAYYAFHLDSWNLFYYWQGNTLTTIFIAGILYVFVDSPIRSARLAVFGSIHPVSAERAGTPAEKIELLPKKQVVVSTTESGIDEDAQKTAL